MCLHGFADTWRTWELVLPALERRHDVLAPTLAGHAGGPAIEARIGDYVLADAVERVMDEAGFETAHIAGNSLGGYVALQLAARGRARSVVAFAPAGGWLEGDGSFGETLDRQAATIEALRVMAPQAPALLATLDGRRRATASITVNFEHIRVELIAHLMLGAACSTAALPLIEHAHRNGWRIEPERIACPVRVVWGTEDRLLPWPAAAARFRGEWLPHADWIELDEVGHCPQLDVPVEAAELIAGFTAP
ncbi:MAG TPA: alpha/beta fold hydrolase [Thermoleophilaceae bacterium]|nr:alpha/beta fold hydrolase [Thermoleophilaceae bacterium]